MIKFFLSFFVFIFSFNSVFSFDTTDSFVDFDAIASSATHTDTIPTWKDLYVHKYCIIDTWSNNQPVNVDVYDDTVLVFSKDFWENECFEIQHVFFDSIKWVNNWANEITHWTNWYYIDEWDSVDYNGNVMTNHTWTTVVHYHNWEFFVEDELYYVFFNLLLILFFVFIFSWKVVTFIFKKL